MENPGNITLEQALQIEDRLNKIPYAGIESGGLFADFIYKHLCKGKFNSGAISHLKSFILLQKLRLLPQRSETKPTIDKEIRFLFNYVSSNERLIDFFIPLLSFFSDQEIACVGKPGHAHHAFGSRPFYFYKGLTRAQLNEWKKLYKPFRKALKREFHDIAQNFSFPRSTELQIEQLAIYQTQRLHYFIDLLSESNVKGIISDYDREHLNACVILAGKYHKTPTYTLIHGSTFPPDFYYPVLSDYMFCWSESQKIQLGTVSGQPEKMIVSGNQKLSHSFKADKKTTRSHLRIPEEKKVVMVITNNIALEERLRFVKDICDVSKSMDVTTIIRIHPSEKKEDYSSISSLYSHVVFIDKNDQTLEESLVCADIIITHNSMTIIEALVKKIKTLIYDPEYISFPAGIGEDAYKANAVFFSRNIPDLAATIEKSLKTPMSIEMGFAIDQYISHFCKYFDTDAAGIIARTLKSKASIVSL